MNYIRHETDEWLFFIRVTVFIFSEMQIEWFLDSICEVGFDVYGII